MKITLSAESSHILSTFCNDADSYVAGFAAGMNQQSEFMKIRLAGLLAAQQTKTQTTPGSGTGPEPTKEPNDADTLPADRPAPNESAS